MLTACTSIEAQGLQPPRDFPEPPVSALTLSPAEAAYVEQTAAVLYRRAPVERLDRLLFSDARGHGTCVRSPAGAGEAADYTLLVLQRRVTTDFISQVDDDVLILRSAADAAPCRVLGGDPGRWIRPR